MSLDVAGLGEVLATKSAAERFLPSVHPLVGFQLVRVNEGLLTEVAVVDLLPDMRSLVHHQVSRVKKEVGALLAAEPSLRAAGKVSASGIREAFTEGGSG